MSRYTGPRRKVMRALGVDLPGLSRKSIAERSQPPGQHGARQQRKSGFGLQLQEKQKLRFNYGLSERQMRRLILDARKGQGATGETLAQLLERRLDNVVFRAGFAPTIPAARQLVNHKHIRVNGRTVNIASYRVRVGDTVSLQPRSVSLGAVRESLAEPALSRPEWIAFDEAATSATVSHVPSAAEVPFPVDMQLVVEYYSQRI